MIYLNLKTGGQLAIAADKIYLVADITETMVEADKRSAKAVGWDRDITVGGARINGYYEVNESVAQIRDMLVRLMPPETT